MVWFSYTTRPPPPVILPAAPFASLWLGGALRRLRPLGSRCRACLVEGFPSWMVTCGGVRRSAMWGFGGVASDNRQDSNQRRLGASAEGRRAWPQAPSPSSHLCRPPRPTKPRVALRRTPALTHAVVRRFLRDHDIVNMALMKSRRTDPNELRVLLELGDRRVARVAHASA